MVRQCSASRGGGYSRRLRALYQFSFVVMERNRLHKVPRIVRFMSQKVHWEMPGFFSVKALEKKFPSGKADGGYFCILAE